MKNLLLSIIILLFSFPNLMLGQSTLGCNENVHISLNASGTVDVSPDFLLVGDVPDGTQLSIDGENFFDKITFDCDDIKSFEYIVKATDGSQCWGIFNIEDKIKPVANVISPLHVTNDAGDEVEIAPDMVNNQSYDNCGIASMRVEPSSFIVYEDIVKQVNLIVVGAFGNESFAEVDINVTVNNIDCALENVVMPLQKISLISFPGTPSILTPEYLVENLGYERGQVEPTFGECEFVNNYSDVVFLNDTNPSFTIERTWVIIDWATTDTIKYNQVLTNHLDCSIDDVSYPEDITIYDSSIDPISLSLDKLMELGFEKSQVQPILPEGCESVMSWLYNDKLFYLEGDSYKIIRTWTVGNWITSEFKMYDQTIKNYTTVTKESIICDVLPRIAPVGDCSSGHTLDDSVEWPAFLEINDYRITPDDLETFSNIQHEDSHPIFYKNQDDLVATYSDKFVEITATDIKLRRVWSVNSIKYGYVWTYEQGIIINYTQGLVKVNTWKNNNPVPNVIVNGDFVTGEDGTVIITDDKVNSIDYPDFESDGITILDFILVQNHLLQIKSLSDLALIAADVNDDGEVSSLDLVKMRQAVLSIQDLPSPSWEFIENNFDYLPIVLRPKGEFVAVKHGDVDDSIIFDNNPLPEPSNTLIIDDYLINKGGQYDIPVQVENSFDARGLQVKLNIDPSILKVEDVVSSIEGVMVSWHVTPTGKLTIVLTNEAGASLFLYENMVNIKAKALENSLLHLAIDTNDFSFSVNPDYELEVISSQIGKQIDVGVKDPAIEGLSVYPNPASDYLRVDVSNVKISGDLSVTIFNANGQEVLRKDSREYIDLSGLSSGMYFYKVNYAGYSYINKLSVVK